MLQDHSKDFQQFRALMGLAWSNCSKDIISVFEMFLGGLLVGALAFVLVGVAAIKNLSQFPPDTYMGPVGMAMYDAIFSGFLGVAYLIPLIVIWVCLFEYALSFSFVCYYYDNKSWLIPKLFNDTIDTISNHFRSQREDNKASARKHRIYMENEVLKIRNGNGENQTADKD